MKVAMYPYESVDNQYLNLIKVSIKELNLEINSFEKVISNKELFGETDYYLFNWYESFYTDSRRKQSIEFTKRILKLIKLKLYRKKIIWTVHNKIPHDSKRVFLSKVLMKFLANNSNNIIIHSNETRNVLAELTNYKKIKNKIVYIPHPNYIGAYNVNEDIKKYDNKKLNLLFVGRIQPYKNVDLLIKVFKELNFDDVTLTIAGKPSGEEYKTYINNLIGDNSNIRSILRFIEDDELPQLMLKSDMLVLPYDIKSSLNSGTIILAFSNKRTVLSPLIGTLKDFDRNQFFAYEYTDEISHEKELKKNLIEIVNLYRSNKNIIENMGRNCYEIVKVENSSERVADIYKNKIFTEENK